MRVDVFKRTQDDWYGSYKLQPIYGPEGGMLVRVSFLGNICPPDEVPLYRTCVWGNDDCGVEFDTYLEGQAWNIFLQVIGMRYVNRDALKELGFVSA